MELLFLWGNYLMLEVHEPEQDEKKGILIER
jgi:hypothetical protein